MGKTVHRSAHKAYYTPRVHRAPRQFTAGIVGEISQTEIITELNAGNGDVTEQIVNPPDEETDGLQKYFQECAAEVMGTTVELRAA